MNKDLALRLLSQVMNWDFAKSTEEFSWLSLMVDYKYDHYQGYSPGARFLVHLISWLKQFPTDEQRNVAYEYIRNRLVFISQREMHHLIDLTMPKLNQNARRFLAKKMSLKLYETWGDVSAERAIKLLRIRTLYIALSDGARIDIFRRENEGDVSNEQVVASVEISQQKWESLSIKLRKRLDAEGFNAEEAKFERICLIDDFTGSGASLIRNEEDVWDGKVPDKFYKQIKESGIIGKYIHHGALVQIHHYLASNQAQITINQEINNFAPSASELVFETSFSHVLTGNIVLNDGGDAKLVALVKDWYDPKIQSTHTRENIWFGYRECGLPLVLYHNTPNNSLAFLWASSPVNSDSPNRMRPLFPRKQRHLDHGQSNAESI